MAKTTFKTVLMLAGKTATGFEVPEKSVEALGRGKRPPVKVTINGYTYRSTVAVMGGKFMIGVAAEHREKGGLAAGDKLNVTLELDTAKREVDVPPDLAKFLAKDKKAKSFFDSLSFTNRREMTESIAGAKREETRQRRLEAAIAKLRAGSK